MVLRCQCFSDFAMAGEVTALYGFLRGTHMLFSLLKMNSSKMRELAILKGKSLCVSWKSVARCSTIFKGLSVVCTFLPQPMQERRILPWLR